MWTMWCDVMYDNRHFILVNQSIRKFNAIYTMQYNVVDHTSSCQHIMSYLYNHITQMDEILCRYFILENWWHCLVLLILMDLLNVLMKVIVVIVVVCYCSLMLVLFCCCNYLIINYLSIQVSIMCYHCSIIIVLSSLFYHHCSTHFYTCCCF